jgi:hypothetical protein
MAVSKITWERVGRVTEPGRYMYTFGWLTITDGDIQIWKRYPHAAFTLLANTSTTNAVGEEFHLGAFDISPDAQSAGGHGDAGAIELH